MPRSALLLTAFLLLETAARSATTPEARVEQLHNALRSIGSELTNQFTIARADIDAGAEADGWTEEVRQMARQWLDGLLTDPRTKLVTTPHLMAPALQGSVRYRATQPHTLPEPARHFAAEFAARLQSVGKMKPEFSFEYYEAVARTAETAWLAAKAPADLLPALRVLTEFRDLTALPSSRGDGRLTVISPVRGRMANGVQTIAADSDPTSALILFSGDEPMLLPDPGDDPAAYKNARVRWHHFSGWRLAFCERFRVSERVRLYDGRFRVAAQAACDAIDRLLMQRAEGADLTQAARHLETFHIPITMPSGRYVPPPPPAPSAPNTAPPHITLPADGAAFLKERGVREPDVTNPNFFRPPLDPPKIAAYQLIAGYFAAPTAPESPEKSALRRRAIREWPHYSNILKSWLMGEWGVDWYGQPAKTPARSTAAPALPALPPGEPPLRAVRTVLESLARGESGSEPGAEALLVHWRRLEDGTGATDGSRFDAREWWMVLAARPGGSALIAARDAALRTLLGTGGPSLGEDALPAVLRAQFEHAIATRDWPRLARLRLIDQVGAILLADEAAQWSQLAAMLTSSESTSRPHALQLINQTLSPAASRHAIRLLKARPAP